MGCVIKEARELATFSVLLFDSKSELETVDYISYKHSEALFGFSKFSRSVSSFIRSSSCHADDLDANLKRDIESLSRTIHDLSSKVSIVRI